MRFREFKKINKNTIEASIDTWKIREAMGGMWDRGLEKKSGKQIQFTSQKTQEIYDLIDVVVFPQDEKMSSYQNDTAKPQIKKTGQADVMQKDIDDYLKGKGNPKLQNVNSRTNRFNAAMLVVVGKNNKPEQAFVKYFTKKQEHRPYLYWQTSVFQRETGLIQSGHVKSASARAAELRIGPDDFVAPGNKYLVANIPGIVENKVKSRSDLPEDLRTGLPALLNNLIKAPKTPAPGMGEYKDTIAVVFGEVVSPIALAMNLSTRGSYAQAEKELLSPLGITWRDFKEVEYGAKGQKLADSYLYAGDVKLVVSSKAKQGSPASIVTALETLQKYPKDFGPKFQKKYQSFLPVLEVLGENDAKVGVLKAAQLRKLITEEESNYVLSIHGKGLKQADLSKFVNLTSIDLNRPRVDRSNPKFDMGYHLLAGVAKELKISLNKDKDLLTDFFKAVLNKSAMVQVYTRIDGNEKGLWFSSFDVIWPPVFTGRIEIESDHYTSNAKPSKKFSFQFSG